jgi:hypothetical protein
MDKDLDIQHYSYEDICSAFKITDPNDIQLNKLREKCYKIKEKYPENVSTFYEKAYKIIECINEMFQQNIILSLDSPIEIDSYVEKMKRIPQFETLRPSILLKKINVTQGLSSTNGGGRVLPIPVEVPTPPIVYTAPQPVGPGSLNSLKRMTQMRNFNLNSCFRHNYYDSSSTDFDYILPSEIKNVISMRLASLELPNSWYLFSQNAQNNTFLIRINQNGCQSEHTIAIPDGNYDNESLTEYINETYLCNSSATNGLQYIRMSIPDSNMKTYFQVCNKVDTCSFSFSIHFLHHTMDNMMKSAGWIFGFRLPNYEHITDCVKSEGIFDGNGDRYLYVSLADYQYNTNSTNIVGFDKSYMDEDILAKVSLTNGKLSMVMEENICPLTKRRVYNGPIHLRKIHIKILDAFGSIIDLNQMDFSMTLELEILYESFQFRDVTG